MYVVRTYALVFGRTSEKPLMGLWGDTIAIIRRVGVDYTHRTYIGSAAGYTLRECYASARLYVHTRELLLRSACTWSSSPIAGERTIICHMAENLIRMVFENGLSL